MLKMTAGFSIIAPQNARKMQKWEDCRVTPNG